MEGTGIMDSHAGCKKFLRNLAAGCKRQWQDAFCYAKIVIDIGGIEYV